MLRVVKKFIERYNNMDLLAVKQLKEKHNLNPSTILDIGANNGYFTNLCLSIWPAADITMIEANPFHETALKNMNLEYSICLLGNENKNEVDFYRSKLDISSTGCSIYKEKTEYFNDSNLEIIKLPMYKLDDITKYYFDFIKMDTQGSELDIIKGGINTIQHCKYLIIEVSLTPTNEGSPLKSELIEYLKSININEVEVSYNHYNNGKLSQQDILFKNNIII